MQEKVDITRKNEMDIGFGFGPNLVDITRTDISAQTSTRHLAP